MRGDGRGGDGLHGLDREGHPEYNAGEDVEEAREDEGAGERDGALQGEGDHEREEGAEIAEGARDFREGSAAEGGEIVPVKAGDVFESHGLCEESKVVPLPT